MNLLATLLLIAVSGMAMPPGYPPEQGGGPPARGMKEGAVEFTRQVAPDAGSPGAPLLFCIGLHIEPFGAEVSVLAGGGGEKRKGKRGNQDYNRPELFQRHVESIRVLASIAEKHGGKLTAQVQTPFTRVAVEKGESLLKDLAGRGHEIALHFHEQAHLGKNCEALLPATWTAVMKEEVDWIRKAAGVPSVRYWSGGNVYPHILAAASAAGLSVMSDHKIPRKQETGEEMLSIWPWRPAGGPSETDMSAFARNDPAGKIVYLPDGIFASADFKPRKEKGSGLYFDFLTDGLERSLRAARKDRVNVFHITVHGGEFRGPPGGRPFEVVDRWLTEVVDPLVKTGKVKWATFSEMAAAYQQWEKEHPGDAPRGPSSVNRIPSPPAPPPAVPEDQAASSARPLPTSAPTPRGYMTFVINVHDTVHVEESSRTVLRLISLFEKYGVRGDFYFTAPIVEAYAKEKPEVLRRLKETGMGICYHVRPPHPLNAGFGDRLKGLSGEELEASLRDYETIGLNLSTGDLDRSRRGGYAYVKEALGKPPVTVAVPGPGQEIKAAAAKVYRALGAKAAVWFHEEGTKQDRPFEWINGLLARPVDFSVTRWANEAGKVNFWWNRMEGRSAAEANPTARLKAELERWKGPRPPFILSHIHENNFSRRGPEAWKAYYFAGRDYREPLSPPFNLAATDPSCPRPPEEQEKIWKAYEEMVAWAAQNLAVVTSADIVALAGLPP